MSTGPRIVAHGAYRSGIVLFQYLLYSDGTIQKNASWFSRRGFIETTEHVAAVPYHVEMKRCHPA